MPYARIKAALDARAWREAAHIEAVGTVLGKFRADLRAELRMEIAKLKAEVDSLQRGVGDDRGAKIVDLPRLPLRKGAS
jgi:hypothetical protein